MTRADHSRHARLLPAVEAVEGAGARVKRLMPTQRQRHLDPFVLLDEFRVTPPAGFPEHPHRGFEAITYMLGGGFEHRDNLGNHSIVRAGGAQRFTAGRGLVHSELPHGPEVAHGLQLWINLPRRLKDVEPSYQEVQAEDIAEDRFEGVTVREIVGPHGPVAIQTPMLYQEVRLDPGTSHAPEVAADFRGWIYVLDGTIAAAELSADAGEAIVLDPGADWTMRTTDGARVAVIAARPHGEPIYQHGPFVD